MKTKSNSKLNMDRRNFIKSAGAATAFTIQGMWRPAIRCISPELVLEGKAPLI